jgi:hypothetical protein
VLWDDLGQESKAFEDYVQCLYNLQDTRILRIFDTFRTKSLSQRLEQYEISFQALNTRNSVRWWL